MYKDITQKALFDHVNLGFEFEFFSPIGRKDLSEKLSKALGKTVHWSESYHSKLPVSQGEFKIEPDFSGGFKMNELITGIMPYNEAIHTLFKIYNFIEEYGFTNERTGVHLNISLNESDLGLKIKMQNLTVFKYILNLDEAKIFDMWPSAKSRIQKIYKNSVLNIYPKNKFISEKGISYAAPSSPTDFNLPHSKYFGLNFTKLSDNYLEIRYAGGKDYTKKRKEAVDLINYIAESLYTTLSANGEYSPAETKKINELLTLHRETITAVKTFENFKRAYPDIEIYADLKNEPRVVEANYPNLKEKLFELITVGNLKKGEVNYDTEKKRVQVKDAVFKESFSLQDLDLINCSIEGEVRNCELFGCKIRSSHVIESKILTANDIRYSYVKQCSFQRDGANRIDLSFINNKTENPIYAEITECIIRSGTVGLNCKVDKKTEFIRELRQVSREEKR